MPEYKQQQFMELYKACHEPFMRYCSALAYGKMDTEDLVQDVLLSAYTHFEKLRKPEDFLHYLIRAARNRSVSNWRKGKKRIQLTEKYAKRLSDKGVSPDKLLEIDFLYKALDCLPRKQKEALILFEVSGFSLKEIAEMQKSTPGAIKTQLSRGRKRLRKLLGETAAVSQNTPSLFAMVQTVCL